MMSDQSLYLFTALEVAEELALRDAEMLRRITPEEITNGAWMDNKNVSSYMLRVYNIPVLWLVISCNNNCDTLACWAF